MFHHTFRPLGGYSTDHTGSTPHKTRQHNNSNNRHPGYKKEDKFVLKKQLKQMNLANNRRIDETKRGLLQQHILS
jgi:hypothetical protein